MQLDGDPATEDLMMQIDQEEKKEEIDRTSGMRRTNTTGQAMSMRPKTVGAKDILGLQGLPKAKQNKGIRPPELDRGTEVNKAGEKDQ